jgi:hypothetical protein
MELADAEIPDKVLESGRFRRIPCQIRTPRRNLEKAEEKFVARIHPVKNRK